LAVVAPRENTIICCDFITFGLPGPTFFAPQTGVRLRQGPGLDFSLVLAPPVRKSGAEGGQRVPNVIPNASKSPPRDLPKSMKNRLCGLRGCPGFPGRSQGTPPARKVQKITFCTTSGHATRRENLRVHCHLCSRSVREHLIFFLPSSSGSESHSRRL